MHDWWLALVAARFGKLVYLDLPTLDYRQHRGNSVGAKNVGSIGYVAKNLHYISRLRILFNQKKAQADMFMKSYDAILTGEDQAFLSSFSSEKSNLTFKFRFLRSVSGRFRKVGFFLLW